MIGLIQRVSSASVQIGGDVTAEIGAGVLALIGIEKADHEKQADRLLQRILTYRIFPDEQGRMNISLNNISGGLLLIPQFTLIADTRSGNRPGFSRGASPEQGKYLFNYLLEQAKTIHPCVCAGVFGADMQVELINNGPVTFWLQAD